MYHMTDRELTQLQETGRLTLPGGYCIGSILEGLDTLGIPSAHAFLHRGAVCEVVLWIDPKGRRPSLKDVAARHMEPRCEDNYMLADLPLYSETPPHVRDGTLPPYSEAEPALHRAENAPVQAAAAPQTLTDYLVGMFPESQRETVRRALAQEPPRPLPLPAQAQGLTRHGRLRRRRCRLRTTPATLVHCLLALVK